MEFQSGVTTPMMGLNDNINLFGKELHVQTENVKSEKPCILTQVFFHGRVVYTQKNEYLEENREFKDFDKIRDMMRAQHLMVMGKIIRKQAMFQKKS